MRVQPSGTLVSARRFGASNDEVFFDVVTASGNRAFVGGQFRTSTNLSGSTRTVSSGNYGLVIGAIASDSTLTFAQVSSGTGQASSTHAVRRVVRTTVSGVEAVRAVINVRTGDAFADTVSSDNGSGHVRDVTLHGNDGVVLRNQVYALPASHGGFVVNALAVDASGRAAWVGYFVGSISPKGPPEGKNSLSGTGFTSAGGTDQFVARMNH